MTSAACSLVLVRLVNLPEVGSPRPPLRATALVMAPRAARYVFFRRTLLEDLQLFPSKCVPQCTLDLSMPRRQQRGDLLANNVPSYDVRVIQIRNACLRQPVRNAECNLLGDPSNCGRDLHDDDPSQVLVRGRPGEKQNRPSSHRRRHIRPAYFELLHFGSPAPSHNSGSKWIGSPDSGCLA